MLDGVGLHVEVAVLHATRDAAGIDVNADRNAVVHRHRERLGAAHPAQPGRDGDGAGAQVVLVQLQVDLAARIQLGLACALVADLRGGQVQVSPGAGQQDARCARDVQARHAVKLL